MKKKLQIIADQALKEASNRRKLKQKDKNKSEINGPKGPEPTRYGDWEKKGITYDF
ncbi:MAG: DUF1674 domain-containing protein [Rickettsiales bacterium]|nr:DUF1674 domain-containing protein [Rickettsiales bacterium]|tara:strand:- start:1561 stop:1728 length:168 start_codon:yes stop_codon:yes gene_type:complete